MKKFLNFWRQAMNIYVYRLPEKYWNLRLPHKLPPRKEKMETTALPMLGFLEQTTASILTKALTAVGCFKPKYPFLSASRSALLYVAYYLKGTEAGLNFITPVMNKPEILPMISCTYCIILQFC